MRTVETDDGTADQLLLKAAGDGSVFEDLALLEPAHYLRLVELVRSDVALEHFRRAA